jgi:small-conductance mechanosensitive channel
MKIEHSLHAGESVMTTSNPEPLVLVENLGSSTVKLRVYFWLDGSQQA